MTREVGHYPVTMALVGARVPSVCSRGKGKPCVVVVGKDVARAPPPPCYSLSLASSTTLPAPCVTR